MPFEAIDVTRLDNLLSRLRVAWFSAHGASIGPRCRLEPGVSLQRGMANAKKGTIALGAECDLRRGSCLHAWGGRIVIGRGVFIGPYAVLYGHGGIEIGERSLISMHCRIVSSNHVIPAAGTDIRSQPDKLMPVVIGRDVWLGGGVTILGGLRIGDGCVVGAGAVVTSDLPPYSVAIGAPASVVRNRRDLVPSGVQGS